LHTNNGGGGGASTGIDDFINKAGTTCSLEQNSPNPFSSSTQINYILDHAGHISLNVYDISGRKVRTLINEFKTSGKHTVNWDAIGLSSGLYFYELKINQYQVDVKKMMLEK